MRGGSSRLHDGALRLTGRGLAAFEASVSWSKTDTPESRVHESTPVSPAGPVPMYPLRRTLSLTAKEDGVASKHDETAKRIAKKKGTTYNRGQGPDVQTSRQIIEVETAATVGDGMLQLRVFRKPVYIAGADAEATQKALERAKGTTIGVMDETGKIIKRSGRKKA